ncbi:topoisomerase I binding, arginine/serine-rich a [Micropterus dolomieu]|uniref:topoisomerase I binding, arginine/serine-rich a n=1 Tax=Micropterus dolomieu TaxID=147949 RepID=UPI001E8E4C50|nr:topoisomerase I binding, arginine/serine-rich a [Micropterus dolomieu]XP_045904027.1 topoisomerase I binding, arginine/serine-rich a [Micropterus dolomieu]
MSAIKIALQQSQKSGRRKASGAMSAEASPDSKCPICLDIFNNISYLDLCLHKFCFRCIHEWSKNKAECPLCKQPFNSIYHSIKSEQDFKKFDLQPLDNGSFGTFGGVRFRYRTTLTGVHRQMRGRTSPPPDNGVMFEASTGPPRQPQDRYIRRMMMRLAAKRRAASEGRVVNNVREQEMVNFRRELYRRGVKVRSVRDGGRSRDTSAEFFRRNPACLHRLIPWLKRELIVLYGAHGSLVNIVQHIIMSRITRYDMEDGAIQEELRPFLQARTEHFLHEFISFAKSPFNMEAYDQHAVYDCPAPSSNEDSSSNSSVIAISEDEELEVELGPPGDSTSTLSRSVWDDETPGPSYSTTAEQSRAECLSVLDSDSDSSLEEERREFGASPQQMSPHNQTDMTLGEVNNEEFLSDDSDDCVIVGFVKPTAERTPELVQLSSNSDESASEDTKEVPLLPQHIRFSSLSPIASQSSDPSGTGQSENVETDHYHQLDSKDRSSSLKSGRHKTSSKSDRKDTYRRFDSNDRSKEGHWSKDRDHRRRRKSRSGEHGHSSRYPVISHSSVRTLSRERGYCYTSGRDLYSKCDNNCKRRGDDHSYRSYRHYNQERNDSGVHYTERRSYSYSSCKYSDRHSRSRSHSRDSRRRDRRHSRSRTYSSSRSPSVKRRAHHDKPGGKRKYKTRHLEEPSEDTHTHNLYAEGDSATLLTKHKKKSKEKHRKKSKERSRKTSRSLSVELVIEENSCERSRRHHKKKKKHKKKSKRHKGNERTEKCSPSVITIDSDSDYFANDSVTQASSTNKDTPIDNTTDDAVDPAPPLSHV